MNSQEDSHLAERAAPLVSNQVQYSLVHREPERNGLFDVCREEEQAALDAASESVQVE
jgi:aryl-alcohol dehydrogenase-like predicted oxidoreductase